MLIFSKAYLFARTISFVLIRECFAVTPSMQRVVRDSLNMESAEVQPIVLVHGGAGNIPDSVVQEKLDGVKRAAKAGYEVLRKSGNLLDAIEVSVSLMEDDEAFNAGRGSALNRMGEIEMEALITEGKDLNAGAVTLLKNVQHPISIARMVMEKTPHTFLGGAGLDTFVTSMGVKRVPYYTLLSQRAINALEKFERQGIAPNTTEMGKTEGSSGTVGCVVVDKKGHVASGTSTGGITGKYKGRIGDTPVCGSGGYSDDDVGAVSTTGHGESIMRFNLAHRILNYIKNGDSAQEATEKGCEQMTRRVGNTAGAITVTKTGEIGVSFTSERMAWAYQKDNQLHFGINPNEHFTEDVK